MVWLLERRGVAAIRGAGEGQQIVAADLVFAQHRLNQSLHIRQGECRPVVGQSAQEQGLNIFAPSSVVLYRVGLASGHQYYD